MESRQALARPQLDASLIGIKSELLKRIVESERRSVVLWWMFGSMVAVAGAAVAALKYLP